MQKFVALIGLCLLLPTAGHAKGSPDQAMEAFIAGDASGDSVVRHGKVLYTTPDPTEESDCDCSVPRESFDVRTDPMIVVSAPGVILTRKIQENSATYDVVYHVLALTKIQVTQTPYHVPLYIRHIVPLKWPEDRHVSYHLRLKAGRWYVVDPPVPYVEAERSTEALRKEISFNRKLIASESGQKDSKFRKVLNDDIQRLQDQATILESLPHSQ